VPAHAAAAGAKLWPWALAFACLANLPIALSVKYQVFILHREFPYGYACLSFYFRRDRGGGGPGLAGPRFARGGARRLLQAAVGGAALVSCISALASNHRVLQILLEKYNCSATRAAVRHHSRPQPALRGRLERTLAGLRAQSLAATEWETILVDNAFRTAARRRGPGPAAQFPSRGRAAARADLRTARRDARPPAVNSW